MVGAGAVEVDFDVMLPMTTMVVGFDELLVEVEVKVEVEVDVR
jgi:hypothetical protein